MTVHRIIDCSRCDGGGRCATCNGRGWVTDPVTGLPRLCDDCDATQDCRECGGTGKDEAPVVESARMAG